MNKPPPNRSGAPSGSAQPGVGGRALKLRRDAIAKEFLDMTLICIARNKEKVKPERQDEVDVHVKIRGEHFQGTPPKVERIHLSRVTSNSR